MSESIFDKAKDALGGDGGLLDKAKGLVSDDQIDAAAEKVKDLTPDQIDPHVDTLAEKAKELND